MKKKEKEELNNPFTAISDEQLMRIKKFVSYSSNNNKTQKPGLLLPDGISMNDFRADEKDEFDVIEKISLDECEEIRKAMMNVDTVRELREIFDLDDEELKRHIYGRCTHDVEKMRTSNKGAAKVSEKECREMREEYLKNENVNQVADEMLRSHNTTHRHIHNRCRHRNPTVSPHNTDNRVISDAEEFAEAGEEMKYEQDKL